MRKSIIWVSTSLEDLKELPSEPVKAIGKSLLAVQDGDFPSNAKSLTGLSGVYEIRTNFDKNTYRAVYAVNLGDFIFVLHAFQKKSKKGIATPKPDMDKIRKRLKRAKEIAKELKEEAIDERN